MEITLVIDPSVAAQDTSVPTVADRLAQLGGAVVSWQPDMNGKPARVTFRFKNPARADQFVAEALAVPGVSLAT